MTRNWPAAARAVMLAIALSALLAVVAIIDQAGGRSLADHAAAIYAPYGKQPEPDLLYGLVYTVAAAGVLPWLLVVRSVRSRSRSARVLALVVVTITAGLALLLLGASEYGAQIFPPLWGILAILPAAAGTFTVVLLRHRRTRVIAGTRPTAPDHSARHRGARRDGGWREPGNAPWPRRAEGSSALRQSCPGGHGRPAAHSRTRC